MQLSFIVNGRDGILMECCELTSNLGINQQGFGKARKLHGRNREEGEDNSEFGFGLFQACSSIDSEFSTTAFILLIQ